MPTALITRRMTDDDEGAVSDLLCDCYRWLAEIEGYTQRQLEFLLEERGSLETVRRESRDQLCLVALLAGVVVGMVAVAGSRVTKLYVAPDRHRSGIGTALLAAAEVSVRGAGFERMDLGTTPSAVPFYEARGMRVSGGKPHQGGVFSGRETILMEKPLLRREAPQ